MRGRVLLFAATLVALSGVSIPHVRLISSSSGNALFWQSPSNIAIVINATGSDNVPDDSDTVALRNSIDAWNDVTGTSAQLIENTTPGQQARTDWAASSIHLMLFDETNVSGYFPNGSGTVALTPVSFYSNGRIADADVLFNGRSFNFTTQGTGGAFDIADVATHELGHFLGLDHSGFTGASLYPYVSPSVILHRSVSVDDENGLQHMYPSGSYGAISGTVRRASNNAIVAGAHVGARDANGRTAAATLANNSGVFTLRGLPTGNYTVYATPLDFPVANANLTPGHTVATDFESTLGTQVAVTSGSTTDYGDLLVGANVTLSLGRNTDDFPQRAEIGATTSITLHGAGLGATCTLTAADPAITVAPQSWTGSTIVTFDVTVPGGAAGGHVDLEIVNPGGDTSILSAALELTPPDPIVTSVVPPDGTPVGGDVLTIGGSNFFAGARVVIGSRVYEDGAAGGCTVVDANTITLTTGATSTGTYDVVVIDETGVEGRSAAAFTFVTVPEIDVVFPLSGSDLGGTQVVITGAGFSDPMTVRLDGVVQSGVVVDSATMLHFTSQAGIAGPAVLEVEDSALNQASAAFTFVAQADPVVADVTPASGSTFGGTSVTITGTNFTATSNVLFDADPDTGLGGTPAATVTFVDALTLTAVTPAHSGGAVSVLVVDTGSGQASVLPASFTFQSNTGGGGGGGGCSTTPYQQPSTWRSILAGAGWIPFVLALLLFERRRARRTFARA